MQCNLTSYHLACAFAQCQYLNVPLKLEDKLWDYWASLHANASPQWNIKYSDHTLFASASWLDQHGNRYTFALQVTPDSIQGRFLGAGDDFRWSSGSNSIPRGLKTQLRQALTSPLFNLQVA